MFYHRFDPCIVGIPDIMAIGPEMDRNVTAWSEVNWNSGVLLINLAGLQSVLIDMIRFANAKAWDFAVADQSLINEYFTANFTSNLNISQYIQLEGVLGV